MLNILNIYDNLPQPDIYEKYSWAHNSIKMTVVWVFIVIL